MLRISVEFLHGTFRGAGAEDIALAGHGHEAEWPPSPARLFQALVAGGGTGDRCTSPAGVTDVLLLEGQSPTIYADYGSALAHSEVVDRYAIIDKSVDGFVQNYPARNAQLVRQSGRVSPANPVVVYEWPQVDPSPGELDGLAHRASRVGYLGCADSPVRVRVSSEPQGGATVANAWAPDRAGDVAVGIPRTGWLEVLDAAFDEWSIGAPRRRSWIATQLVRYQSPAHLTPSMNGTSIWLRFDRPIRSRLVLIVAETLKNAVLSKYTELIARGNHDLVPPALHGHHAANERAYQHVHWLPLPFAGTHDHADGRIRGACVWIPSEYGPDLVDDLRLVLGSIKRLVQGQVFDVAVGMSESEVEWRSSTSPSRWVGPSKDWVTVFPVVQERRVRGDVTLDVVAEWCQHVGLPSPTGFAWSTAPFVAGAARLRQTDMFRDASARRPYGHLTIRFDEEILGPVALGRGRQYGLGLMAPLRNSRR